MLRVEIERRKSHGRSDGLARPSTCTSPFPFSFLLSLFLLYAGCADPRPPTGGPRDQIPPALEATTPEPGAVNVAASSIRLVFSEYVDQASFARALSITPAPEGQLRFNWSKRRVEVRFPDALRENTTYVLTLDTNLRDAHGVVLKKPITFAFSTGPVINQGRIAGRVLDARQGAGVAGYDVLAYAVPDAAAPDSLPENPDYRTQTDENGQFLFEYLSEQPYFVIAVQDRNRNRRPDATEAFAVPPRPTISADPDTTAAGDPPRWLVTRHDTLAPALERVRPQSSRRLQLRFSEAIQLTSLAPDGWLLEDSLTARPVAVQAVYLYTDDPRQVYLLTDSLAAAPYGLRPSAAVIDSSGNGVLPDTVRFTPSALPDTLHLRFLGFAPDEAAAPADGPRVLPPAALPGVRFNQPVTAGRLAEIVAAQDSSGQTLSFEATTPDGATYRLRLSPLLQPGRTVEIRVDGRLLSGADTVYTRVFQRISERALGSLSGLVAAEDTSGAIVVELYATGSAAAPRPLATTPPDATGAFSFPDLPEGAYEFRAFVDRNGNGRWDGGQILPFQTAEPVAWTTETLTARPRWDSALKDTLRISGR